MNKITHIFHVVYTTLLIGMILVISGMQIYPERTSEFLGFRFYTVLTDSMEPTIPTFSLVLTRILPKTVVIEPNTIITFQANRFGEKVLFTHYFRKTQEKDGKIYYRTQQEGEDINDVLTYDNYMTTRDDIVGTYMFHIPYLGKILLFLKSPFGYVMYAELFIIFLINQFVKAKWKEKDEKVVAEAGVTFAKGEYEEGYVEGDIELLIDLNDFNNIDKALKEIENFNKEKNDWY